jgi:AraC-like DNA-binding protein
MLGYAGWYSHRACRDVLFYIPFQQLFLLPPVLYFYCRTLLDQSFEFSRKHLFHFLPAALYLVYSAIVFVTDKVILQDYYFYKDGKDKDLSTWYQVAGFISLVCYALQSLAVYKKYKTLTYQVISFADSVMFKWAQRFLLSFLLLLGIRLLFFVLNPEWDQFGKKFWYYVCFSILFYYISISGYINAIRSFTRFKDEFPLPAPVPAYKSSLVPQKEESLVIPAVDSDPDDHKNIADLAIWKEKIERLMETDKLFENPALTLADVCNQLGIHTKKASQLINQGFNMNFNDFVNHYRTQAVIGKMEEGGHNLQTLLGIAFECGFNSKSTFNRAFKRYTSLTPKEYIQKNGLK